MEGVYSAQDGLAEGARVARRSRVRCAFRTGFVIACGLFVPLIAGRGLGDSPAVMPRMVAARQVQVSYRVNPASQPLERVDLYYSQDGGTTWSWYGADDDLRSPMLFSAPGEGEYGFFIVLRNAIGASSSPPIGGTAPQQTIVLDWSPPLLQAHSAALTQRDGQRTVALRWTAYDAHFGERPMTLEYAIDGLGGWNIIATEAANQDRYDWLVPDALAGAVVIRLTAADAAGNVASVKFSPLTIERTSPLPAEIVPASYAEREEAARRQLEMFGGAPALTPPQRELFDRLMSQARWHTERGEWPLARQRLAELLAAVPGEREATLALAEVEYRSGRHEDALRTYDGLLEQGQRDARLLRGHALAAVAVREYPRAANSLLDVLALAPDDAQTMIDLGDVMLMMGNRGEARRLWQQARSMTAADPALVSRADQRLRAYADPPVR